MLDEKTKRARRRQATLRVALGRRLSWARRDGITLEVLRASGFRRVTATLYFAKNALGCRGSKKRLGHPKGGGWCKSYDGRTSWKARVRSRRMEVDIMNGRLEPEWVSPPRGFWGMVEPRPPRLRDIVTASS
jgi:hypothetical protein